MRHRYEFLLTLNMLECEMQALTEYAAACSDCYELLQHKLDDLQQFMGREETIRRWSEWGHDEAIAGQTARLRNTAAAALCEVEKYVSRLVSDPEADAQPYFARLLRSVKGELESFGVNSRSKVLFIGSGAFPVSVLTIAKHYGARVVGVDWDPEAVRLARDTAKAQGLERLASFTDEPLGGIEFLAEATHIIIASLVENKLETIGLLKDTVRDDARIMVRFGNGAKSMFNYPLQEELSGDWVQSCLIEKSPIYDSIILEKSAKRLHAGSLQR